MSSFRTRGMLGIALLLIAILAIFALPAAGLPPQNDERSTPTSISSLPYSESLDTFDATQGSDDPYLSCSSFSGVPAATVWYSYLAVASESIVVDTAGSSYQTIVAVLDQSGNVVACNGNGAAISASLVAGTTYEIVIGANGGSSYPYPGPGQGGNLELTVTALTGPDNDDFAQANPFAVVPYSDLVDLSAATTESSEPSASCAYYGSLNTVWYAYTPAESGSYSVELRDHNFEAYVAAYEGVSLSGLTELGCRTSYFSGNLLTVGLTAGTTYFFQVGLAYPFYTPGPVRFTIDVAPPPIVDFYYWPWDPSQYDQVQFSPNTYDPAGVGISDYEWSFGDGADATGCCPQHNYGDEGEFTVDLTVYTPDGRTATTSQTLMVETHDVIIEKFKTPNTVRVGQTRQIVVGLTNSNYDENVTVYLYRSTPNGFQFVGSSSQLVPVRPGNRQTEFVFNYTFTDDDAIQGSVTFRAFAEINGNRDALPLNNEAISFPTNVNQ